MGSEADCKDTECGFGSFRPRWLQKLNSPKTFFFVHCTVAVMEGALISHIIGSVTTLEKRFEFDTSLSGIILFGEDVAPILTNIVIGYFGAKSHRPRIMALGLLIISFSSFVISLPYFIYGARYYTDATTLYDAHQSPFNSSVSELCTVSAKNENCELSTTKLAFYLLFLGQFIKGLGSPSLYTLGTSYMDDGLKKEQTPTFLGTLGAFLLLGPTLGSLISSFCLHFYEDPFYDPGFDQNDPRWVGAWWLGFIMIGSAVLLCAVPMSLFPRIPKRSSSSPVRKSQPTTRPPPRSTLQHMKDFFQALCRVTKNPILLCYYFGSIFRMNGMMGYYILIRKYMEMQFRQTASEASLYAGPVTLVGMQVGSILGGVVIARFRPGPRVLTGTVMTVESFSFIALIICMFITCPPFQLTGTSIAPDNSLNLWNSCNENCSCTTNEFTPVCGPDGRSTYFSACFAGCDSINGTEEGVQAYTNCYCVHDENGEFSMGSVIPNYCASDCHWMVVYIVILALGKMTASTAMVGNMLIMLRCVDKDDRSIALGTVMSVVSLLAFIPHPLLYGAMTDSSCLVWEESCGKRGNCWIYDVDKFRYLLHGVSAAFVFVGCVCDVLVWILSPRIGNLYKENDDDPDETQKSLEMKSPAKETE